MYFMNCKLLFVVMTVPELEQQNQYFLNRLSRGFTKRKPIRKYENYKGLHQIMKSNKFLVT